MKKNRTKIKKSKIYKVDYKQITKNQTKIPKNFNFFLHKFGTYKKLFLTL